MHRIDVQQRRDIKPRNSSQYNERDTKEAERKYIVSCAGDGSFVPFHLNDINQSIIRLCVDDRKTYFSRNLILRSLDSIF